MTTHSRAQAVRGRSRKQHMPTPDAPGCAEGSAHVTSLSRPPTLRWAFSEASSGKRGNRLAAWPEAEPGCPPGVWDTELTPRTHGPANVESKRQHPKGGARKKNLPPSVLA